VAKELITVAEYGANEPVLPEIDEMDFSYNGFTPLHFAAEEGHSAMVRMLLKFGADRTIKDSRGRTPLEVAMAKNDFF
jgi:hypothetical protein